MLDPQYRRVMQGRECMLRAGRKGRPTPPPYLLGWPHSQARFGGHGGRGSAPPTLLRAPQRAGARRFRRWRRGLSSPWGGRGTWWGLSHTQHTQHMHIMAVRRGNTSTTHHRCQVTKYQHNTSQPSGPEIHNTHSTS